jgi:hypothetical protein
MVNKMLDINLLEQVMKLMSDNEVDEVACEEFTIKKSRHKEKKKELTDEELLKKHLDPLPQEPWLSISESQLDEFSIKGKI